MRPLLLMLIGVLAALVLVFTFQNLESVTVAFLSMQLKLPVSVLVILISVAGMFTGGAVLSVLRGMFRRALREEPETQGSGRGDAAWYLHMGIAHRPPTHRRRITPTFRRFS